jgi:hypothetical protein
VVDRLAQGLPLAEREVNGVLLLVRLGVRVVGSTRSVELRSLRRKPAACLPQTPAGVGGVAGRPLIGG